MADEIPVKTDYDIIIVGAGISGINAAYRVQTQCPGMSLTVLEGRERIGGTWDLFKFPGIRSDSDLYTFGFVWEPWNQPDAIAEADAILNYLNDVAKKHHITDKIEFQRRVEKVNWKSGEQKWELTVTTPGSSSATSTARTTSSPPQSSESGAPSSQTPSRTLTYRAKFIILGTGYYDYTTPLETKIPGISNFAGPVVHPQFWPSDLDYTDKHVAVIGSGATAVTLLPSLARDAKHVTQIQRSPGWYTVLPAHSSFDTTLKSLLPTMLARQIIWLKYLIIGFLFVRFCRFFPSLSGKLLTTGVVAALPKGYATIDPDFKPSYNPWEQRMCLTPAGDREYFAPLRNGKAELKTGKIRTIGSNSIVLESGDEVKDVDVLITATGLKMQVGGGAALCVDGQTVDLADKFMWKGTMVSDMPNLFYTIGYTDASWTLGCDAATQLATRVINDVTKRGLKSVTPKPTREEEKKLNGDGAIPLLDLSSTYIQEAVSRGVLPKAGKFGNWRRKDNYIRDMYQAWFGDIHSGIEVR